MVKEIKKKTPIKTLREKFASPFFIPYAILFFVFVTLPIIYWVSLHPLELRERAATIASGSVTIETNEHSFQQAAQEIIPVSTINMIISILILTGLVAGVSVFILYRRKKTF